MNQSKKILAALVAIPASVVVAGEVQAAEATVSFEINNDFVSGKAVDATAVEDLNSTLNKSITDEMATFKTTFSTELKKVSAADAQKEVEKVFQNLKANLSTEGNTVLYGLFKSAKVKAIETGEGDARKVALTFTMSYYGTSGDKDGALKKFTDAIPTAGIPTDVLGKVKYVHDYIISNSAVSDKDHSALNLGLKNTGSSHAYSVLTYMLLTEKVGFTKSDIRYVYGMKNGVYHSWNIVKIDGKWYNLDVAADDTTDRNNKDVSYRYFLTNNLNEHRITVGADGITLDEDKYNHLATVDNKAVSDTLIYYADTNGKIQKLNKDTLLSVTNDDKLKAVEIATAPGKLVYIENEITDDSTTPATTTTKKSLYFINTSMGHYLYELVVNSDGTYTPNLLIQEPIESISASGKTITYKTVAGKTMTVYVTSLNDAHNNAVNRIKTTLLELADLDEQLTTAEGKLSGTGNPTTNAETTLKAAEDAVEEAKKRLDDVKKADPSDGDAIKAAEDVLKAKETDFATAKTAVEQAKKEVTDLKAQIEKLKADSKAKIVKIRELYTALTPEQKVEATKDTKDQTNFAKLIELEKIYFPKSGTNSNINTIISDLNALDIFKDSYYREVEDILKVYDGLTAEEKKAVYNSSILDTAKLEIKKIDDINADFKKIINGKGNPFEEITSFITEVEKLNLRYEKLLSSLQIKLESTYLEAIEQAAVYRANIEKIKLQLSNTDETTADYLKLMKEILEKYNKMTASEKALFTAQEVAKITAANDSTGSVEELGKSLEETLKVADVTKTTVDAKLYTTIQSLHDTYAALTPAQKAELNEDAATKKIVEELIKFKKKFDDIAASSDLKTIEESIVTFTTKKVDTLTEFESMVKTVNSSIKTFESKYILATDVIELLFKASNTQTTLTSYREAIETTVFKAATDLETSINALNGTAKLVDVVKLRTEYTAVHNLLKIYISIDKLEVQEVRIIELEIDKLTDESSYAAVEKVQKVFESISAGTQRKVNKAKSIKLAALWAKVRADAKDLQEAINNLNNKIKELNEDTSTLKDIKEIEEAYNALDKTSQEKIEGYGKIEDIKLAIELRENSLSIEAAANVVINLILKLTEESPPTEIEEARAAYKALENLELLSKTTEEKLNKAYKLLEYYEEQMEALVEKAKEEAAVVIDRINRITSSYTETQINSIRIAYNASSVLAKKYISNVILQKLIDAEARIIYQNTVVKQAKLEANAFDLHMNTIDRNSSTEVIAKARAMYNRLSAEAKRHVTMLEKLVRLETMWKDPEYLDLVFTYYPDYIHNVKPGAIETNKPKEYDSLYIPDDSSSTSTGSVNNIVATIPNEATWSPYEKMMYQNGRYVTKITSTQVANVADRNMMLKADDIEVILPVADLKASSATVGVSVSVSNSQLNIQFTEGNNAKYFSEYVEIHIPMSLLKGSAVQMIERISASSSSVAVFKVEGSKFIIRTKSSGTFRTATSTINYTDAGTNAQGNAIRELAKRGITYHTTSRLVQPSKQVNRGDVAVMIATALDLSSTANTKYEDLGSAIAPSRAQGLREAGIMTGTTSSRFSPNATVSKQEAAIIIANMYRYLNQDLSKAYNELNSSFTDVSNLTLDARQSIAILELFGVVEGSGAFNPTQTLSRGQFAELIYKSLKAIDFL